jgi:outer membrane lipopolysaccharide assembly protein LptE/RlpB
MIMSLNISSSTTTSAVYTARKTTSEAEVKLGQAKADVAEDNVSIGGSPAEALTYSKPRALPENLSAMLAESDKKVEELMSLLRPLLEQQGLTMAKVVSGEQKLTVDQATIDKAKEAISEDGEMGVRKVSERILSFAKFAIGDDPDQLSKIRDAVELGFSQAKEALGGTLPEISQKTHDTIMAEFDRWEKEGIPAGDTVSLKKPETTTQKAG